SLIRGLGLIGAFAPGGLGGLGLLLRRQPRLHLGGADLGPALLGLVDSGLGRLGLLGLLGDRGLRLHVLAAVDGGGAVLGTAARRRRLRAGAPAQRPATSGSLREVAVTGRGHALHQLDERHGLGVALARAELEDARVAAVALRERRADVGEQLVH